MNILTLRQLANREIIDYPWLMNALKHYKRPREKLSVWLKSGELVRVKKGLYLFGATAQQTRYNSLVLANLIYGPSVVSLAYALSYYGMIPERVNEITSVTCLRDKLFETPIGRFSYRYLRPEKYPYGVQWVQLNPQESFLIATPEKALCDHLMLTDKKIIFNTLSDVEAYLENDMRIDMGTLTQFKTPLLREIINHYDDDRLALLYTFIQSWKQK
ncbi:MAG TPA: hypothetical protein VFU82_06225 [Gammaproteobacteria bacterium]|nr:hypothetical protein [Gammaproteobacteria bacterium]